MALEMRKAKQLEWRSQGGGGGEGGGRQHNSVTTPWQPLIVTDLVRGGWN